MYNNNGIVKKNIILEHTIEYEEGSYFEQVGVLYDPEWDTIQFEGHFENYDDFEAVGLTDTFKKALNELDITQLCNDSILCPVEIDNITITFHEDIYEDDLKHLGYYQMWKKLVEVYGQPQLFVDGICTLDSIEKKYNELS